MLLHTPRAEQFRNLVRNFRRGIKFGVDLRALGILPKRILEFGPGSGYFSAGLQQIFPKSEVVVVNLDSEVLEACKRNHGFSGSLGSPDDPELSLPGPFDLIIARDVIEHVNHPERMMTNIQQLLNPGGYFHFITPNGVEDVWPHRVFWKHRKTPSQLQINHVNYFTSDSLKNWFIK